MHVKSQGSILPEKHVEILGVPYKTARFIFQNFTMLPIPWTRREYVVMCVISLLGKQIHLHI